MSELLEPAPAPRFGAGASLRDVKKALAPLSPKQAAEQREERHHKNSEAYRKAEQAARKAERGQGDRSIDIVYEAFQDLDAYTADPGLDKDFHLLREMWQARRPLPVKQYRITLDGQLVKDLTPAAIQAVRDKLWCVRCEQPQPEDSIRTRESWDRVSHLGIDIRGYRPSENCHVCGARLGLESQTTPVDGPPTPEQQAMIDKLNGKAPNV